MGSVLREQSRIQRHKKSWVEVQNEIPATCRRMCERARTCATSHSDEARIRPKRAVQPRSEYLCLHKLPRPSTPLEPARPGPKAGTAVFVRVHDPAASTRHREALSERGSPSYSNPNCRLRAVCSGRADVPETFGPRTIGVVPAHVRPWRIAGPRVRRGRTHKADGRSGGDGSAWTPPVVSRAHPTHPAALPARTNYLCTTGYCSISHVAIAHVDVRATSITDQ